MAVDLRVNICGIEFKNPVIAASGTFAFGEQFSWFYDVSKLGGIALKALTPKERIGNPPPRVAETPSGMLNSVGLQNPGVDRFIKEYLPKTKELHTVRIANVAGSTMQDYLDVIKKLNDTDIDMYELNISCPNVKNGGAKFGSDEKSAHDITKAAKAVSKKPLMVKLTPNVTDIAGIACAVERAGADAVSLINTITGMAIDLKKKRPVLAAVTGGLSGPAVKPVALRMVYETAKAVKIPVVGMGGITTGEDAAQFMLAGASAVMVGTYNLISPKGALDVLSGLEAFAQNEGIQKITELTGALKEG